MPWKLIAALIILAAGGIVGWLVLQRHDDQEASAELDRAVAEYLAVGMPFEAKDIEPKPPVSHSENAAAPLQAAMELFNHGQFSDQLKELTALARQGSFSQLKSGLEPYDRALDLAVNASKYKRLDFSRDWDMGVNVLFPEYAYAKGLTSALCLRAQASAGERDIHGAVRDLRAARSIGVLMDEEPSLISCLVRISVEGRLHATIIQIAEANADSPYVIKELLRLVEEEQPPVDFVHALRGEAFLGVATMRNLALLGGDRQKTVDPAMLQRTGLPKDVSARASLTRFLQAWTRVGRKLKQHPDDVMKIGQEIQSINRMLAEQKTSSHVLLAILFPVFDKAAEAILKPRAEVEGLRAILNAILFQQRTGRLPSSIDDLPGNYIDPFTGGKLRLLQMDSNSVKVYSVGGNRTDDGGVDAADVDREKEPYDLVLHYPAKPLKNS